MNEPQQVVAAALVRDGTVLAARRTHPPELAGRWEYPGGKVEPGETPADALRRECREELGIEVTVGAAVARFGGWLTLFEGTATGEPRPFDHDQLRWVTAADAATLDWVATNFAFLPVITRLLSSETIAERSRSGDSTIPAVGLPGVKA